MDDETRATLAVMRSESQAAFGRIDRYFELNQLQYTELRGEVGELRREVGRLDVRLTALEESLRSFRDWVTIQFAELRAAIQHLGARVDRLEKRQGGPVG